VPSKENETACSCRGKLRGVIVMKTAFTLSLALIMGLLLCCTTMGQVESSASASVSSQGPMEMTIGTFVYMAGDYLALEIVRDKDCKCMCEPIEILGIDLEYVGGVVPLRYLTGSDFPVLTDDWVGMLVLTTPQGDPLPGGKYAIVVKTDLGTFRAILRVIDAGAFQPLGHVSSTASVCSVELRLYRLLTKETDRSISLHVGEKLLIALEGNMTTGYLWEQVDDEGAVALSTLEGPTYQPSPSPVGMVGSGGRFLFRYRAEAVGQTDLIFNYCRAWEEENETDTITFHVTVK
jgi:predicted secreted protein